MFALRLIGGELRLEIRSKAVLVFVNVPGRNVSDGLFHHVVVTRFMHLMELLLDDGEGVNYVSKTQLEAENLGLKFARDKFSTQRCPTAPSAVLQVPPASKAQSHIPIPTGRLEQQFGLSDESNYVLLQDIRLLDNWRKAESELVQWLPLSDKEVAENKNYKNRSAMPPTALVNQSWAPCSAPSSACGPTQNCKSGLKSTVCHCDPCQNVSELPLSNSSYPSAVWACARLGENPCAQSSTCPSPDTKCVVRPLQPSFVNGTLPNSCDFLGPNIPISTKQPGEFPVVLVASAGGLLLLILLLALLFVILYICWRRRRLRQQVGVRVDIILHIV